jgi:hypothetical protein
MLPALKALENDIRKHLNNPTTIVTEIICYCK